MKLYDVPLFRDRRLSTRSPDNEAWYTDARVVIRKSAMTPECLARFSAPGCVPTPRYWEDLATEREFVEYTFIGVVDRPSEPVFPSAKVFRAANGMTRLIDPRCDPPDTLWSTDRAPKGANEGLCWDAPVPEKARYCVVPACLTLEQYEVREDPVKEIGDADTQLLAMQSLRRRRRRRAA